MYRDELTGDVNELLKKRLNTVVEAALADETASRGSRYGCSMDNVRLASVSGAPLSSPGFNDGWCIVCGTVDVSIDRWGLIDDVADVPRW